MLMYLLVTLQWEWGTQTALFDIGQQLSLVTSQKHVHVTFADTHMRVTLYRCLYTRAHFPHSSVQV